MASAAVVGDVGFEYLDRARSDEFFTRLKAESVGLLAIGPGDRVLDVGCGTGEEVVAMSAAAASGCAVGLDLSPRNVIEAQQRHRCVRAAFVVGDGHALPFADCSFDGVRAERTLQHVVDAGRVVLEIARTLRPSGRVVLSEPDWACCALAGASQSASDAVLANWIRNSANPRIGRHLPGLLADARLDPDHVQSESVIYRSFAEVEGAVSLRRAAELAVSNRVIDQQEADAWIADLTEASERGRFLFSIPMFTAVGIKPKLPPDHVLEDPGDAAHRRHRESVRAGGTSGG